SRNRIVAPFEPIRILCRDAVTEERDYLGIAGTDSGPSLPLADPLGIIRGQSISPINASGLLIDAKAYDSAVRGARLTEPASDVPAGQPRIPPDNLVTVVHRATELGCYAGNIDAGHDRGLLSAIQ